MTSGGGGAGLYDIVPSPLHRAAVSAHHYLRIDVNGEAMTVAAVAIDGRILDRFSLVP